MNTFDYFCLTLATYGVQSVISMIRVRIILTLLPAFRLTVVRPTEMHRHGCAFERAS